MKYNCYKCGGLEVFQSARIMLPMNDFEGGAIDMNDLVYVVQQLEQIKIKKPLIWNLEQHKFFSIAEHFPKGSVLTPKEREVFMLLRKGMLDKQIADNLKRSIHTIRVQIRSIKRKRPFSRRSEL